MKRLSEAKAKERAGTRVPADLRSALRASARANAQWDDLTAIAQRDFVSWIEAARQQETRKRRVEKACSMLSAGKRRPCCYSVVSFDFYTALKANPGAKARWGGLTPVERREFISWVDSRERDEHRRRVVDACLMLADGSRAPSLGGRKKAARSR